MIKHHLMFKVNGRLSSPRSPGGGEAAGGQRRRGGLQGQEGLHAAARRCLQWHEQHGALPAGPGGPGG